MKARKSVATEARSFRTFLLMQQFAAKEIGARIAQARREASAMTQEQLADLLDVSTRAVQDYEGGVRIPWKHFKRLEQIFGRELEWFLHGEQPEQPALLERLTELDRKLDALDRKLDVGLQGLEGRLVELAEELRARARSEA